MYRYDNMINATTTENANATTTSFFIANHIISYKWMLSFHPDTVS
jgi:hypothetical protein